MLEEKIGNGGIKMGKYKKPQVYVINNSSIAKKIGEKYVARSLTYNLT